MKRATAVALVLLLAALGYAQPINPGQTRILRIAPEVIDTQPLRFRGRSDCSILSIDVRIRKPVAKADANPGQIVVGQSVEGCEVFVQFNPAAGCASTSCRRGNWYQVDARIEDGQANRPVGSFLVYVEEEVLQVP